MFNKDFYPTPNSVIDRMLLCTDFQNKVILEPSAGKGNIVDYLQSYGAKEVVACELNSDLAKIVGAKCRLIGSDFLKLKSEDISHIDMIVMNPPFSDEEHHIMHAWEIAPDGCVIVSLCNAAMFRVYNEKQKQVNELIKLNGRSERFGNCFSDSERQTDVEIGCIWLYKPVANIEDEFDATFDMNEEPESGEGLVKPNYIRDLVWRYIAACKMFGEVMEASSKLNDIVAPIKQYGIKFGAYKEGDKNYSNEKITYEVYKKEMQKQCWERIFADMNMEKYVTKGVRDNINKFVEQQVHVPFTVKNVYSMLELIVGTHGNRMAQVLIEAFDLICYFSHENSTAGEKWKTNSDYMVNKKFIVPYICDYDARWPSRTVHISYCRTSEQIVDLTKALCLLTGTAFESIPSLSNTVENAYHIVNIETKKPLSGYDNFSSNYDRIRDRVNRLNKEEQKYKIEQIDNSWGTWIEWGFFKVKGFKKGTMHFEFLDESVWMKFNIEVAKARGWNLPKQKGKEKGTKRSDVAVSV